MTNIPVMRYQCEALYYTYTRYMILEVFNFLIKIKFSHGVFSDPLFRDCIKWV